MFMRVPATATLGAVRRKIIARTSSKHGMGKEPAPQTMSLFVIYGVI
jgi:hypothetical protein